MARHPQHNRNNRNRPGNRHGGGNNRRGRYNGPPAMAHTRAPYNFVPLNRGVFFPDWAEKVSHDIPLEDGYCGTINLKLTAKTKLLIGGDRSEGKNAEGGNPGHVGEVKMFVTPDGEKSYAIPGSSIRGMIRNVIEIASFGKMNRVNEGRPWVRDADDSQYIGKISGRHNKYENFKSKVKAGFLRRDGNGQWELIPCQYARIEHNDLHDFSRSCGNKRPDLRGTGQEKYQNWLEAGNSLALGNIQYQDNYSPPNRPIEFTKATFGGHQRGQLVFTNQVDGKHREFVFYNPDTGNPVSTNELTTVVEDFLQYEGYSAFWRYLCDEAQISGTYGVPIFYIGNLRSPRAIGLAQMIKIHSSQSIHDRIQLTAQDHSNANKPDLAELIFGHLGNDVHTQGLKARAHFGLAKLNAEDEVQTTISDETILGQPRPTFYPHYLKQDANTNDPEKVSGRHHNSYLTEDAQISGRKRYPARTAVQLAPIPLDNDNLAVRARLEQIPADTTFTGTLHIHNMNAIEIGALLWALDFGGRTNLVHTLGMGKPFGMGTVAIEIDGCALITNDPNAQPLEPVDMVGGFMNWAGSNGVNWARSEQIRELLAMADPAYGDTVHQTHPGRRFTPLMLEPDNEFAQAKKHNLRLRPYSEIADFEDTPPEHEVGIFAIAVGDWVDHPNRPVTGQVIDIPEGGNPVVRNKFGKDIKSFPLSDYTKIDPPEDS